jgi:hypothetical protein
MPIYTFSKRKIRVEDGVYNPLLKKGFEDGPVVILLVNDIVKPPYKKEHRNERE